MEIKHVKSKEKLKEYYDFIARVFYEDAVEFNEHYYPMGDRYKNMLEQYENDKTLLIYLESDNEFIGATSVKEIRDIEATLQALAVDKKYRGKGYAKLLMTEIENRLKNLGVDSIVFGVRFRACGIYLKAGYKPTLLVQVNDFATIDLIKKSNKYNYEIVNEYQTDTNGAVFFKVDTVSKEVVDHFNDNVPTANTSYIFSKKM